MIHSGNEYPCEAANLSREGTLVVGRFPIPADKRVRLSLQTASGDLSFQADCLIAHVAREGEETSAGLKFGDLDRAQKTTLEAIISRVIEGGAPGPLAALGPDARPDEIRTALEKIPIAHRMALAQRAASAERGFLRLDTNPQVLEALARNPNLTPPEVMALAKNRLITPATVELIARDARWRKIEELRITLVTHPQIQLSLAESIVATFSDQTMDKVLARPGLHPALRLRLISPIQRASLRASRKD